MSARDSYAPGPATGARIHKEGEQWTLVLVRELSHSRDHVWQALTDPAQLREWAPFDVDHPLDTVGATINLTTVGAPSELVSETQVIHAHAPSLLEFTWGGGTLRWELHVVGSEARPTGTRLTLWHNIDRRYIAMGAAGWHICLDALSALLANDPIGRRVGMAMMTDKGWQRLRAEYAQEFDVPEMPQ